MSDPPFVKDERVTKTHRIQANRGVSILSENPRIPYVLLGNNFSINIPENNFCGHSLFI